MKKKVPNNISWKNIEFFKTCKHNLKIDPCLFKITSNREKKCFISVIRVIRRTSLWKISTEKVKWFSRKRGRYPPPKKKKMALNRGDILWIEISVKAIKLTKDIYTNFHEKMLLVRKKLRNLAQPKLEKLRSVNLLIW